MTSQSWWKLAVEILLPLLALLLWAAWQSGGLEGIKEVALGAKEYLPDVEVGLDELSAERVALPVEIQKDVTSLKETLQKMAASNKINCFAKFDGFRSELGNDDSTISLSFVYDPSKELTRVSVNKEKSLRSDVFEVKGMKPCVIAGTGGNRNIAENFYNYFIDGKLQFEPYYKWVQMVNIYYRDKWNELGGNKIEILEFGAEPVNDEGNNFQSKGFLFKGREGEICFFPTIKGVLSGANDDGIAEEWFTNAEQNSISNRLARNEERMQWCWEETTKAEAIIPPAQEISIVFNSNEKYFFLFNREIDEWQYRPDGETLWILVSTSDSRLETRSEPLPGGVPLPDTLIEIIKTLPQLDESLGAKYLETQQQTADNI